MSAANAETEDFALTRGTHAHRLARYMAGRWVSQLRAACRLHICEIHPRLPDIKRAGGDYKMRLWGEGPDKWAEYTLVVPPRVKGVPEEVRRAYRIQVPGDNVESGFIPPEREDGP